MKRPTGEHYTLQITCLHLVGLCGGGFHVLHQQSAPVILTCGLVNALHVMGLPRTVIVNHEYKQQYGLYLERNKTPSRNRTWSTMGHHASNLGSFYHRQNKHKPSFFL